MDCGILQTQHDDFKYIGQEKQCKRPIASWRDVLFSFFVGGEGGRLLGIFSASFVQCPLLSLAPFYSSLFGAFCNTQACPCSKIMRPPRASRARRVHGEFALYKGHQKPPGCVDFAIECMFGVLGQEIVCLKEGMVH